MISIEHPAIQKPTIINTEQSVMKMEGFTLTTNKSPYIQLTIAVYIDRKFRTTILQVAYVDKTL